MPILSLNLTLSLAFSSQFLTQPKRLQTQFQGSVKQTVIATLSLHELTTRPSARANLKALPRRPMKIRALPY